MSYESQTKIFVKSRLEETERVLAEMERTFVIGLAPALRGAARQKRDERILTWPRIEGTWETQLGPRQFNERGMEISERILA